MFQSKSHRSWRKACSQKCLKSLLRTIRGLDFGSLACLIVEMTQWSLISFVKIPISEYLWGAFIKNKSRREDFSGFLRFGRVEPLISCVRLNESQVDLKLSETGDSQSQLKSPVRRISLKLWIIAYSMIIKPKLSDPEVDV